MVQNRLQQAIELAQQGKRAEARLILSNLVAEYPDLEMAWLWLATVAASPEERLAALRRVVEINPANQTARAALEKLGEPLPVLPEITSEAPETRALLKGFSAMEIAAFIGVVLIIMAALIIIAIATGSSDEVLPTSTRTPTSTATFTSVPTITLTPSATRTPGPSPTPLVLPPTWTPEPSFTPRPTRTLAPTITPFPTRTPFPSLTPIFIDETTAASEVEDAESPLQPVTFTPTPE